MSVDHTMQQCPSCDGSGGGHGFVTRTDGCQPEWIPCRLCGGTERVTTARALRYARGRAITEARIGMDLSLREFAAKLGLEPVDVSGIEHGRAPEEWLRRAEVLVGLREEEP